jgi:stage II sporulation protein D
MRIVVGALLAALVLPAAATAGTVFLLDGRGWGHGVGMSQWGAEGYALHGYDYRRILAHYYPHTALEPRQSGDVRVLLGRGRRKVRVGSAAPFVVVDARGRKLHLPARTVIVDRRFVLQHVHLAPPLTFEPGGQPLTYDLDGYRGTIVVQAKPKGLMAVNALPVERYLRGVVPWEMPGGWNLQAYEVQAVASRSYALAMRHPMADFDVYADDRSQMYGGIRAERAETNLAVGATAEQVLTYGGAVIPAFFFSTSGGRTSSVHDAWPWYRQVPYLVSVADPYDYLSPRHVWPTQVLPAAALGRRLGLRGVRDAVVVQNSSGRAAAVRVLAANGWHRFGGRAIRRAFHLGSTDFQLSALTLDAPRVEPLYGARLAVEGWVRGLGKARLEELTPAGWATVARVHPAPDGRFRVSVRALRSTSFRLAYNDLAGDAVPLQVAPRVTLSARGRRLRVRVAPQLPLQVQRLTRRQWKSVARRMGSFSGELRPGSYRVAIPGQSGYLPAVSRPVGLRG